MCDKNTLRNYLPKNKTFQSKFHLLVTNLLHFNNVNIVTQKLFITNTQIKKFANTKPFLSIKKMVAKFYTFCKIITNKMLAINQNPSIFRQKKTD